MAFSDLAGFHNYRPNVGLISSAGSTYQPNVKLWGIESTFRLSSNQLKTIILVYPQFIIVNATATIKAKRVYGHKANAIFQLFCLAELV